MGDGAAAASAASEAGRQRKRRKWRLRDGEGAGEEDRWEGLLEAGLEEPERKVFMSLKNSNCL